MKVQLGDPDKLEPVGAKFNEIKRGEMPGSANYEVKNNCNGPL